MGRTLLARGGDVQGTHSTVAHMRHRNYPVSMRKLGEIPARVGLTPPDL